MVTKSQNGRLDEARAEIKAFLEKLHNAGLEGHIFRRLEEIDAQIEKDRIPLMSMQLHQVTNPSIFIEEARIIRRKRRGNATLRLLEIIRNVLILFPLGLTWLALWQAFQAFKNSGLADMDQFLWNWINGFDGRLSQVFTFNEVAKYDFLIILSIIGLTILVQFLNIKFEEETETEILGLATDLDTLLWRLTQALKVEALFEKDNMEIRTLQIMTSIDEFVGEFKEQGESRLNLLAGEQEHLEALAKLRNEEISGLQSFSKEFQNQFSSYGKLNQDLIHNINKLAKLTERINDNNMQTQSNQEKLSRSLQSLEGQFNRFESVTVQLSQGLQSSTEKMGYALSQNAADMQGFTQIVGGLQNSVNLVAQNQKLSQESIFQNQKQMQESLSSSMSRFMSDFENMQQRNQESIRDQNAASARIMQSVNEQISRTNSAQTQLTSSLQSLEQQFNRFQQATQELGKSLQASATSLDAVNTQNRAVSEKYDIIVSTVQDMAKQQETSQKSITQGQSAFALSMQESIKNQNENQAAQVKMQKELQQEMFGMIGEMRQGFEKTVQNNNAAIDHISLLPNAIEKFSSNIDLLKKTLEDVSRAVKESSMRVPMEEVEIGKDKDTNPFRRFLGSR